MRGAKFVSVTRTDPFKVKQVRGPFVAIEPHPETSSSTDELVDLARSIDGPVAADLFCGCGGMSLGLEAAGFTSIVGVDYNEQALETYNGLFAGMALHRDLSDPAAIQEVVELLRKAEVDLISGGPPCQPFSRAGRSRIRELVDLGLRDAHDHRRDLWQSFVEIVAGVKPRAAIMENVPELALGDDMRTLRTIVDELEGEGYDVYTRILSAPDLGIPQFRQRMILVAIRDGGLFSWPEPVEELVTLGHAIGDLPPIEGGWRPDGGAAGYQEYLPELDNEFVAEMRDGIEVDAMSRLYDHITKPVREDDREIFAQMDSSTKYSDIEESLKRYRDDIFDDKYKRLDLNQPSRSITAHIAKDGYWYIHPTQERTLSVREAARLQTFPDRVRFAGGPSSAFRQIGNAVPPRLSSAVGAEVAKALVAQPSAKLSTRDISKSLSRWFSRQADLSSPWYRSSSPWSVIQAEAMLGRRTSTVNSFAWPLLEKLGTPADTLLNGKDVFDLLIEPAKKSGLGESLRSAAEWYEQELGEHFILASTMSANPFVGETVARLAEIVAVPESDIPIHNSQGALRVAARHSGQPVDRINKGSDGRIAIARLVGGSVLRRSNDQARKAHLALLELAESNCIAGTPSCSSCPLRASCHFAAKNYDADAQLFG